MCCNKLCDANLNFSPSRNGRIGFWQICIKLLTGANERDDSTSKERWLLGSSPEGNKAP
jgi:hypothetical protein